MGERDLDLSVMYGDRVFVLLVMMAAIADVIPDAEYDSVEARIGSGKATAELEMPGGHRFKVTVEQA